MADKRAEDAALAYALWDAENTVRMKADECDAYFERAKVVRYWLRLHGHEIMRIKKELT